jgi:uncharacterized protein YceK
MQVLVFITLFLLSGCTRHVVVHDNAEQTPAAVSRPCVYMYKGFVIVEPGCQGSVEVQTQHK